MIRKRTERRILLAIAVAICIGVWSVAAHHRFPHVVGVSHMTSVTNSWIVDVEVSNPTAETVEIDIEVNNRVSARSPRAVAYSQGHATAILSPGERCNVPVALKQRPTQYNARITKYQTVDHEVADSK